ncbi:hypothetical protein [Streptomyces sp. NBC_01262]|uniref:hypothetical protein n=1 Tax=Streptomyces sp. NBC_01262 TaxID=2903803 RepID=UPI002E2F3722|nr:hypothetical protein [Streptomyces sp. NBC_01262]
MVDAVITGNFFQEIMAQIPEFDRRVTKEMEWNSSIGHGPEDLDHFKYNPYTLTYELFDTVLIPALNSPELCIDLLTRCFAILEHAALSVDSTVRGNLAFAVADFLLDDLGPTTYSQAGPAFRALMVECLAEEGLPVPESWR